MSDQEKLYRCMGGKHCNHIPGSCTATNTAYQGRISPAFVPHPVTSNQFDDRETGNTSDKPQGENAMKIGDTVRKTKGYPFPGVVVADFTNYKGDRRVVVEARHPDILGCLHIYNPDQLEVVK